MRHRAATDPILDNRANQPALNAWRRFKSPIERESIRLSASGLRPRECRNRFSEADLRAE